jgi:hypothetical protein
MEMGARYNKLWDIRALTRQLSPNEAGHSIQVSYDSVPRRRLLGARCGRDVTGMAVRMLS